MIKRLLTRSSILELAKGLCVLGKHNLRFFCIEAQAEYFFWLPSLTKELQTEPKESALRWWFRQTQSA